MPETLLWGAWREFLLTNPPATVIVTHDSGTIHNLADNLNLGVPFNLQIVDQLATATD